MFLMNYYVRLCYSRCLLRDFQLSLVNYVALQLFLFWSLDWRLREQATDSWKPHSYTDLGRISFGLLVVFFLFIIEIMSFYCRLVARSLLFPMLWEILLLLCYPVSLFLNHAFLLYGGLFRSTPGKVICWFTFGG